VFFCCTSLLRFAELFSFVSMIIEEGIFLDRGVDVFDVTQKSSVASS
jgi:hypothetical protein